MPEVSSYERPAGARSDLDADVIVVGNGPVGATLGVLLAQRGRRVTVLERRRRPYTLPRATSFDGETARLLAGCGTGAGLGRITEPAGGYQWRTAAAEILLDIAFRAEGPYGWPDANTMHQPALEELLAARASELPGVTVVRGRQVVGIEEREDRVAVTAEDEDGAARTYTARWVVGCDGANSFVRHHLDVPVTDLGFSYEWLLCDVELREPGEFVPTNVQICDPARPTTLVGSGPGHRRWEFMRLPGERAAELNREETAWRLLAPYGVTPDTATLLRSTTYIFQARWADRWRAGRVLLAGDAAHLMPPFAGQGMCSGIRDVVNLAWKLDLVLGGLAPKSLLDTYTEERRAQVHESILSSVQLGRVICVTDPTAAAERDATILAGRRGRGPTVPDPAKPLTQGLLHRAGDGSPAAPAGEVIPQGRVRGPGGTGLFDDVIGRGFVLLLAPGAHAGLDEERSAFLTDLGTHVVRLLPEDGMPQGGAVADVGGVYRAFLARHGADAVLVRPDYHVYGAAAGPEAAAVLVDGLRAHLGAGVPAGAGGSGA
ncbi:bifunctional 3-(3-hydroxy-phenyl)propionate/3-hydroxycinnamic acid hydroxylase [Streptomyces sp. WI04-05B]|uniref:bifunctional 3-(3-hydroxy-phenyl)propionate/3-hydroxycinnamic acid hydroxylase MhpA n=1 Tax=Streptomyces TaxID=1883 RepID=UPI0029B878EB|nr:MULTISPECIES: bifunctional 3-(3-hydroxy-phenyl)propionate/3-hydroxycinnamic acid hydroxylase [unclassified Streptomyces]MDX2547971.1 bifunctional 3-(3-hydroxy-phenyl)propionate/3-hydroxycinnamic acid hydroxylase [Streptomyces sp. WI04-05B]MDX2582832.1 bifunctional 3-(3-hydroxy-phenyl)propionate/3-hydroxycinnamic acid hydroxylase [Streptomyces sp. WI04-05A]MDX3746855.1 bifunctional 3-(3-hydroxy-phenyl)propionate/3-hydroxycinnamic acid hydroxylase [Streptomyces sp. AK08-02]